MTDSYNGGWDLEDGPMKDLLIYAQRKFNVFNSELVKKATNFAIEAHKGKRLLHGVPVIGYLICTAVLLASSSNSDVVVASGLLLYMKQQYKALKTDFGREVAKLVRDVSKLSMLSKIATKERLGNFERMPDLILAMVADVRSVMIKIAERTVQMTALDTLNPEKKQRFMSETSNVYLPLSERLNFNLGKSQLQHLCFEANEELKNLYASVSEYDEDGIALKVKLQRALKKSKLPYIRVESRKRSLHSIRDKMSRKNIFFSDIRDIISLRIIVEKEEQCYRARHVVEKLWKAKPQFGKDYIKNPKLDRYRSLHVIVQNAKDQHMTVQIRTSEMHGNLQVPEHVESLVEFARLVSKRGSDFTGVEGQAGHTNSLTGQTGKGHVYVIVKDKNKVAIKQHPIGTKLEALCQQWELSKGRVLVNEAHASPSYSLRSGDIIEFVGFFNFPMPMVENKVKDSNNCEGDLLDGSIKGLLRYAESKFEVLKSKLVKKAAKFAIEARKGKKRLDGSPVIDYLIYTAILLASSSNSEAVVASGLLLCDSLCDTKPRYHALENKFGKEVANLVTDVSKLSKLSKIYRKEQQLVNSKRMLDLILAMVVDARAVMIKIAERTVQMIALDSLNPERKRRFVKETLDLYVPLSERLNFNLWKSQLQNLCFDASDELKKSYASISEKDEDGIAFKVKLEDALKEENLPDIRVESRKKSLQSIQNKISMYRDALKDIQVEPCKESLRRIYNKILEYRSSEKENNEMSEDSFIFSEIRDIIGLRIIVKKEEDCYLAKYVVEKLWKSETKFEKDYITNPNSDGYRSLHLSVKNAKDQYMEVQIRTEEMHMKSDDGHWLYKEGEQVPEDVKMWVEWARLVSKWRSEATGVEGQTTGLRNSSPHKPECPYANISKPPCVDATGVCKFPGKGPVYVIVKAKNKAAIKQHLTGTRLKDLCLQRKWEGRVVVNEVDVGSNYILRAGDIIEFV